MTLLHFEMPLHLAKHYGGFRNREVVDYFVHFARVVFERYKDKVTYWMTFNEIDKSGWNIKSYLLWTNSGVALTENDNPEEVLYA